MAWSWSHSQEAYCNARDNVLDLPRDVLEVIYGEQHAGDTHDSEQFSQWHYARALSKARKLTADILAESVAERMEELATCSNGGHRAWVCPYGCHTVSFDRESVEAE